MGRLRGQCRVVTMDDIRGNGASGRPADSASYAIARHCDDILSVADAVHAGQFSVWGYSYGGNIARYIAARSHRVAKAVIVGVPFGAAARAVFRDYALNLRAKWTPVIEADRNGSLDLNSLSEADRALWARRSMPATVAQLSAILDWPAVEPADLRCPTLWVVGTANEDAMPSVKEHSASLARSQVVLHLVPGLTHAEKFTRVDDVLPPTLEFILEDW